MRRTFSNAKEKNTIAIAFKASEWELVDRLLIDLSDPNKLLPKTFDYTKQKNGMVCLLKSL